MRQIRISAAWFALLLVLLASCEVRRGGPELRRYSFTHPAMGTSFRIVLFADDSTHAAAAASAAFGLADSLEAVMSDYRPYSELNRLSATAGSGHGISVSEPLLRVLLESVRVSERTDGAFDVTMGTLTRLWRRGLRRGEVPPDSAIARALAPVGYRSLQIDSASATVTLTAGGTRLDLGGIAKGFAADRMLDGLKQRGITRALVDAGGDIAVGDPPPGAAGWRIGVDQDSSEASALTVLRRGVATSGDRYRFLEVNGRRYSHIVDPASGYGTLHTQSVTVLAPTAALADAFASAFTVLPAEEAIRIAESQQNIEARILSRIDAEGSTLLLETSGFPHETPPGTSPDS